MDIYILLDVGGTQIKSCACDEHGKIYKEIQHFSAHSREDKDSIFDNFASIIMKMAKENKGSKIGGVGMAFPGPFDYDNGISQMKDLDKYEDIYGIPIETEIKERLMKQGLEEIENARFTFLHDVEAFGLGISEKIDKERAKKIFCLCMGTGAGAAFIQDGFVLKNEKDGVPQNGWIYKIPYKDSILDDYLSARGLARLSKSIIGKRYSGKELFALCENGDKKAQEVYLRFGEMVTEGTMDIIEKFQPDILVVGGQIAKSFQYFGKPLSEECLKRGVQIYLEQHTSLMVAKGLWLHIERSETLAEP